MSSWWRKFAESVGVPPSKKSWRVATMQFLGLTREELSQYSGGWDRRYVHYYDRIPGTGPWARHLVIGGPIPPPVSNGVVNNGVPVVHEGIRVVHNG